MLSKIQFVLKSALPLTLLSSPLLLAAAQPTDSETYGVYCNDATPTDDQSQSSAQFVSNSTSSSTSNQTASEADGLWRDSFERLGDRAATVLQLLMASPYADSQNSQAAASRSERLENSPSTEFDQSNCLAAKSEPAQTAHAKQSTAPEVQPSRQFPSPPLAELPDLSGSPSFESPDEPAESVEPPVLEPTTVEPTTVEPTAVEPEIAESPAAESPATELPATEPLTPNPEDAELPAVESLPIDPAVSESPTVESPSAGPPAVGSPPAESPPAAPTAPELLPLEPAVVDSPAALPAAIPPAVVPAAESPDSLPSTVQPPAVTTPPVTTQPPVEEPLEAPLDQIPSLDPNNFTPTTEEPALPDSSVVSTLASRPDGNYRYLSGAAEFRPYSDEELQQQGGSIFVLKKEGNTITGTLLPRIGQPGMCVTGALSGNTVTGAAYPLIAPSSSGGSAGSSQGSSAGTETLQPYGNGALVVSRPTRTESNGLYYAEAVLDLSNFSMIYAGVGLPPTSCSVASTAK
jgi:hypothetical protein